MGTKQIMAHCKVCREPTLHLDQAPDHLLHLLLTLLTCSLWLFVWVAACVVKNRPQCTKCGTSQPPTVIDAVLLCGVAGASLFMFTTCFAFMGVGGWGQQSDQEEAPATSESPEEAPGEGKPEEPAPPGKPKGAEGSQATQGEDYPAEDYGEPSVRGERGLLGIPLPANSRELRRGSPRGQQVYRTPLEGEAVRTYFLRAMKAEGWTLLSGSSSKWSLHFARKGREAWVGVEREGRGFRLSRTKPAR